MKEATMNTAKLIIGQDVFLISGCYHAEGKIVQTSAEGTRVLLRRDPLTGKANVVWEFDSKGEALNCMGTAEYGPFTMDDMPFEARRAELAGLALKREFFHKKYPNGFVIPANEPLPPV
jgi:hypothetical protein